MLSLGLVLGAALVSSFVAGIWFCWKQFYFDKSQSHNANLKFCSWDTGVAGPLPMFQTCPGGFSQVGLLFLWGPWDSPLSLGWGGEHV